MHALEIIIARNAEAAGITVEENLRDARAGQFISQADQPPRTAEDESRMSDVSHGHQVNANA